MNIITQITIKNTHYIKNGENYFILKDNLEINTPFVIYLFQPVIKFLIIRHLKSQFKEDEIFRERLQLMKNKFGDLKEYIWLD